MLCVLLEQITEEKIWRERKEVAKRQSILNILLTLEIWGLVCVYEIQDWSNYRFLINVN